MGMKKTGFLSKPHCIALLRAADYHNKLFKLNLWNRCSTTDDGVTAVCFSGSELRAPFNGLQVMDLKRFRRCHGNLAVRHELFDSRDSLADRLVSGRAVQ